MPVRFVRPVSRSSFAARRFGLLALALLLGAWLAHRFGQMATPWFVAFLVVAAAIAALATVLGLIGVVRLWQKGAASGFAAITGIVAAAPALAVAGIGLWLHQSEPPLYEVSSDTANPPGWIAPPQAARLWLERDAVVPAADRALQLQTYPVLTSRRYEGALDRIYRAVNAAATGSGIAISGRRGFELIAGEEEQQDPAADGDELAAQELPANVPIPLPRPASAPPLPGIAAMPVPAPGLAPGLATGLAPDLAGAEDMLLQGSYSSPVFGFPFDVAIRLDEGSETTSVDIRVTSRYGSHDLGQSAAIALDFLDRLDSELFGIARRQSGLR